MFSVPLDIRLEQSTHQLKAWIANIRPAFKQAQKESKALLKSNQSDIREYFQQTETTPIELTTTQEPTQSDNNNTNSPNSSITKIDPHRQAATAAHSKHPQDIELNQAKIKTLKKYRPHKKQTATQTHNSKQVTSKHQSTRTIVIVAPDIELPP